MSIHAITRATIAALLLLIALLLIAACGSLAPASSSATPAATTPTTQPTGPTPSIQATPSAAPVTSPSAAPGTPAALPLATVAASTPAVTPAASATGSLPSTSTIPAASATAPTVASTSVTPGATPSVGQASGAIALSGTPTVVGTPAANPTAQAIQSVILQNNLGQIAAFANGDPTAMKGSTTSAFYQQMVQSNQQLASAGATSLRLVQLVWGPIQAQGPSARATTYETWLTVYQNGQTELQERDENVYDLVQQGGQWLIQADNHPNDQTARTSGGPRSRRPPPPIQTTPPAAVTPSTDISRNWSGYSATGGQFTAVTGTWIVARVDAQGAATPAASASWVGIGGVTSRDLIQSGSEADVVGPGDVVYGTWIELLPAASTTVPLVVVPGDSLTVTITQTQSGTWSISLTNNTTGKNYQTTARYRSSYSSAEWVEEAGSTGRRVVPLDNFGIVQFSNDSAVLDGKKVNLVQAGAKPITMAGPNGQPAAVPSAIGGDGSSFSVKRT